MIYVCFGITCHRRGTTLEGSSSIAGGISANKALCEHFELNSLPQLMRSNNRSKNKEKKTTVCMTNKMEKNCNRNGLSSYKCCNYLHARLSSISICLRVDWLLWHTEMGQTHKYTHIYIHSACLCGASSWIQVKCVLHMRLCWHYYNTLPYLTFLDFSSMQPRLDYSLQSCNFFS